MLLEVKIIEKRQEVGVTFYVNIIGFSLKFVMLLLRKDHSVDTLSKVKSSHVIHHSTCRTIDEKFIKWMKRRDDILKIGARKFNNTTLIQSKIKQNFYFWPIATKLCSIFVEKIWLLSQRPTRRLPPQI